MDYFIGALKKYAVFSGRARRSEYWYFVLFTFLFSIVAGVLDGIIGTKGTVGSYGFIFLIYYLAILVPSIAVAVRRLHDVNKSGWMLFLSFIPVIGFIWILILMVRDSDIGDNNYGPNPKNIVPVNTNETPVAPTPTPEVK
jgi:uncharacterized membrane protein YhaH (DUF805 family)